VERKRLAVAVTPVATARIRQLYGCKGWVVPAHCLVQRLSYFFFAGGATSVEGASAGAAVRSGGPP